MAKLTIALTRATAFAAAAIEDRDLVHTKDRIWDELTLFRLRAFLLFVFVLFPLSAGATEQWSQFTDREMGFGIAYPKSWEITRGNTAAERFVAVAPDGSSCSVIVDSMPKLIGKSSSSIATKFIGSNELNRFLGARHGTKVYILQKGMTKISNNDAVYIIYKWRYQSGMMDLQLQTMMVQSWIDGYSYKGTCFSTEDKYFSIQNLFVKILSTMVISGRR